MEDPIESPPPAAFVTSTSTTKSQRIGRCVTCCAVVSILALIVILIIVSLYFNPSVSSPEFQISSISVSTIDSSSSSPSSPLSVNWKITFQVRTPTDLDRISYDQFEVMLLYHGVSISSVSISPFYQRKGDQGLVEATMVSAIYDDLKDGAVNFAVAGDAMVRVGHRGMKGHWHHLKVSCDNVMVGFSGDGSGALVGGSGSCQAHIKKHIWELF